MCKTKGKPLWKFGAHMSFNPPNDEKYLRDSILKANGVTPGKMYYLKCRFYGAPNTEDAHIDVGIFRRMGSRSCKNSVARCTYPDMDALLRDWKPKHNDFTVLRLRMKQLFLNRIERPFKMKIFYPIMIWFKFRYDDVKRYFKIRRRIMNERESQ